MNYSVDPEDMAPRRRKAKNTSFLWTLIVFSFFCLAAFISFAVYLKHSRDELPLPAPSEEDKPPQTDHIDSIIKKDFNNMNDEPISEKSDQKQINKEVENQEAQELPKEQLFIEPNPRIEDFIKRLKTETDEEKLLAYVELYHKEKVDFNKLYEDENKYKGSAFHFVAQNLMVNVLKKMNELQPIDIEKMDEEGFSVLHAVAAYAVLKSDDEIKKANALIKILIEEADFGIDLIDESDATPLISSIWNENTEMAEIFLELGASPHPPTDPFRLSPLNIAVTKNNFSMVKLLVEKGADVLALDSINESAFHAAARLGHIDIMRLFLDNYDIHQAVTGISTDAESQSQWTVLHFAAADDHVELVKLLLIENEIDDIPDKNGAYAQNYTDNPEILSLFENKEALRLAYLKKINKECTDACIDREFKKMLHKQAEDDLIEEARILAQF